MTTGSRTSTVGLGMSDAVRVQAIAIRRSVPFEVREPERRCGRPPSGPTRTTPEWKGHERLGRASGPFEAGQTAIAAGADNAAHALHAVDQLVVEVADSHAEAALAEIIGSGSGVS
jgi:hypothetical protein